jgi:hypothetical protein
MNAERILLRSLPALLVGLMGLNTARGAETLPPLGEAEVPRTFEEMWGEFDPRAEPLDVEVLHQWEEEGVAMQVLRYRVGIFKGRTAMMAAIYGHPVEAEDLPGLVQIHGGGQYADHRAVLANAKRGYATIAISWAGRISAPDYRVTPKEVKLFWEGKVDDPAYRLTTDWGALDAYHAPSRYGRDAFGNLPAPADWVLDPAPSPRNSSWFLCTMAARRALTFLEQQPEVNSDLLGVYGHSMGGKLTVLTAGADHRVRAAAPSCGGISDRYNRDPLHRESVGDAPSLQSIACPTIFLSPANDFHGHINDLIAATAELGDNPWRVTCSPHMAHKDLPEHEVATLLWFDEHLRGVFTWPATPVTAVHLDGGDRVPVLSVAPDASRPILAVDVYYTQQGIEGGDAGLRENRINRFWHHAAVEEKDGTWAAELPLSATDKSLWVYANVLYALDDPVSGAGYYHASFTADSFVVSSLLRIISPAQLQAAGQRATLQPELVIETFEKDWEKEWFTETPGDWTRKTHKVYHPLWSAPEGARLVLEVRAGQANKLVVGIDQRAVEVDLVGGSEWQQVILTPADFTDAAGAEMIGWEGIKELRLGARESLKGKDNSGEEITRALGASWQGGPPEFRNLRWLAE